MRLMHLGMDAFVVGDTTTPGITAEDLLRRHANLE